MFFQFSNSKEMFNSIRSRVYRKKLPANSGKQFLSYQSINLLPLQQLNNEVSSIRYSCLLSLPHDRLHG